MWWWILPLVVLTSVICVLEWRSWRKPASSGFDGAHGRAHNIDRSATGGVDI